MTDASDKTGLGVAPFLNPAGAPLYRQAKALILKLLSTGEWPQGKALPSESQLAARFGVSPGTIRKAIAELVREKALVRFQGLGTFVPARDQDYMLDAFFHIVDRTSGVKSFPKTELLTVGKIKADRQLGGELSVAPRTVVTTVENLLYLGDRPVIFDKIFVPAALFPDLDRKVLQDRKMTIFGIYQSRYGVTVTRVKEWIVAAASPAAVAKHLGIQRGAPVLEIERTAYTYEGKPVEYRLRYVKTDRHGYLNELGMKG